MVVTGCWAITRKFPGPQYGKYQHGNIFKKNNENHDHCKRVLSTFFHKSLNKIMLETGLQSIFTRSRTASLFFAWNIYVRKYYRTLLLPLCVFPVSRYIVNGKIYTNGGGGGGAAPPGANFVGSLVL
jgi:hypothetical protein